MSEHQETHWSRRQLLGRAMFAGCAGLLGAGSGRLVSNLLGMTSQVFGAEPPPETTRLRLVHIPNSICVAPQYVAEELLHGEGFTDVQYVGDVAPIGTAKLLLSGEADITMAFAGPLIIRVDADEPIVLLAGVHVGCFELFGSNRVRAIRDLRGKTVSTLGPGSTQRVFISIIMTYVGLDPNKDVNWVTHPPAEAMRLLGEGKIDAFLGFPPQPQELRAKKIGHPVVNSAADRPWSQYFCCIAAGNREFVRKNPVATKRAARAILKAADICARDPARAARFIVDKGYTQRYEYALEALKMMPYDRWREDDPNDTIRFYALRLHEAGMIKSSPQRIIARGADWRFLKELKKEMKG